MNFKVYSLDIVCIYVLLQLALIKTTNTAACFDQNLIDVSQTTIVLLASAQKLRNKEGVFHNSDRPFFMHQ